jgi:hypothetical protein
MLQLAWTATAVSLVVCTCFALALRGLSDASAAREHRRTAAAVGHVIGAAIPLLVCLGAVGAATLVLASG